MDSIQEALEHLHRFTHDGPEAFFGQIELTLTCIIEALSELENRQRHTKESLSQLIELIRGPE